MKTKKENLLVVAGVVWALAGINILRIGITSYIDVWAVRSIQIILLMLAGSLIILTGFSFMFRRVVNRNIKRISGYEEKKSVFYVFDLKGYLMMAFMMGLGIGLRMSGVFPVEFFAVFYTGLGSALIIAGVRFAFGKADVEKRKNENT